MVKIRLKRIGSKFNAYYRIVVADARAPRDGRFIEEIGTYDPHKKNVTIKEESKKNWLDKGAIPTQTVKILFKEYQIAKEKGNFKDGMVTLIKKPKKPKSKKEVKIDKTIEANENLDEPKVETNKKPIEKTSENLINKDQEKVSK